MTQEEMKAAAKGKMDELSSQIDGLKEKMNGLGKEASIEFEEELKDLQAAKEAVEAKVSQLSDMAEDKWEEFKETYADDFNSLKNSIKGFFK